MSSTLIIACRLVRSPRPVDLPRFHAQRRGDLARRPRVWARLAELDIEDAEVGAALADFVPEVVAAYEGMGQTRLQARASAGVVVREMIRRTAAVVRGEEPARPLEELWALPLSDTSERG